MDFSEGQIDRKHEFKYKEAKLSHSTIKRSILSGSKPT